MKHLQRSRRLFTKCITFVNQRNKLNLDTADGRFQLLDPYNLSASNSIVIWGEGGTPLYQWMVWCLPSHFINKLHTDTSSDIGTRQHHVNSDIVGSDIVGSDIAAKSCQFHLTYMYS